MLAYSPGRWGDPEGEHPLRMLALPPPQDFQRRRVQGHMDRALRLRLIVMNPRDAACKVYLRPCKIHPIRHSEAGRKREDHHVALMRRTSQKHCDVRHGAREHASQAFTILTSM